MQGLHIQLDGVLEEKLGGRSSQIDSFCAMPVREDGAQTSAVVIREEKRVDSVNV